MTYLASQTVDYVIMIRDTIELNEHSKTKSINFYYLTLETGHTLTCILLLYKDISVIFIYQHIDYIFLFIYRNTINCSIVRD